MEGKAVLVLSSLKKFCNKTPFLYTPINNGDDMDIIKKSTSCFMLKPYRKGIRVFLPYALFHNYLWILISL